MKLGPKIFGQYLPKPLLLDMAQRELMACSAQLSAIAGTMVNGTVIF